MTGDGEATRDHLNVADVAGLLGVKPGTVRAYESRGQMPASAECPCCGLGPVWPREEIEQWLTARPGQGRRGIHQPNERIR